MIKIILVLLGINGIFFLYIYSEDKCTSGGKGYGNLCGNELLIAALVFLIPIIYFGVNSYLKKNKKTKKENK